MKKEYYLINAFLTLLITTAFGCACEQSSSSSNEQDLNNSEVFSAEYLKSLWGEPEDPTHGVAPESVDLRTSSLKRTERTESAPLELSDTTKRARIHGSFSPHAYTLLAQNALLSISGNQASIETVKNLFEIIPKLDATSNFSLVTVASRIVTWAEKKADTRWTELNNLSDYGKRIISSYLLSFYYYTPQLGPAFNKKRDFKMPDQDLITNWKLITLIRGNKYINIAQVHSNLMLHP